MKKNIHNKSFYITGTIAITLSLIIMTLLYTLPKIQHKSPLRTPLINRPAVVEQSSFVYQSQSLNFSITVPEKYLIEEKQTYISLRSGVQQISIGRSGTNFNTIEDHLAELANKNKLTLNNRKSISINDLPALVTEIYSNNRREKVYFIYRDYVVYNISTDSPILFNDLDRIAQSFRYTP